MIGTGEIIIVVAIIAIFFFGKGKVIDWVKGVGEAQKAYKEAKEGKEETKK